MDGIDPKATQHRMFNFKLFTSTADNEKSASSSIENLKKKKTKNKTGDDSVGGGRSLTCNFHLADVCVVAKAVLLVVAVRALAAACAAAAAHTASTANAASVTLASAEGEDKEHKRSRECERKMTLGARHL